MPVCKSEWRHFWCRDMNDTFRIRNKWIKPIKEIKNTFLCFTFSLDGLNSQKAPLAQKSSGKLVLFFFLFAYAFCFHWIPLPVCTELQFTVVFHCVCLTFPEIQAVVIGVVPERAIWNDKQVVSFQNNGSDFLASTLLVFHKLHSAVVQVSHSLSTSCYYCLQVQPMNFNNYSCFFHFRNIYTWSLGQLMTLNANW